MADIKVKLRPQQGVKVKNQKLYLYDPSMIDGEVALARDWAIKTDGLVDEEDYSSKAWAIGGQGTETNNSKYYAEQAKTSETNAANSESQASLSATSASNSADLSKQWAIGEPTEPIGGSAKYWASQSSQDVTDIRNELNEHITNKNNPHEVTKAQVGLSNVDNTADIDKPIIIKSETIPTADVTTHKKIYQYSGTTNSTYTHGYIYECQEKTIYNPIIDFESSKIGFNYDKDLLGFFAEITPDYLSIKDGVFEYLAAGDIWAISGKDENGNTIFSDYKLYTDDLRDYGFVFLFPEYADGEQLTYSLYLNGSASYVWQRIDVQPNTAMWGMIGGNLSDQTDLNNSLTGLQNQIDDLSGRGRFLSLWNCATGLAATNPPESPYTYKDGDYFIVGTVSTATPAINYKPDGSSYTTGTASTTVETAEVKVDDTYIYDGTNWKLQSNTQKTVTFASIAGQPTDNANLSTALNTKVDKTSTASRLYGTDSTGAQALYVAGENIELASDGKINVVGVQQQMFEMPEATVGLLGSIVQYMGETNATYTHGVMYQCVPVYGDYTATYVSSTISNVVVNTATFDASNEYVPGTLTYTFTCTNGGLRQQWRLPSGMSTRLLGSYGISYTGRAAANDTITITKGVVGYTWEAYAGISSGNDKIRVVGDKVYGVNVVGQYNINTCPDATEDNAGMIIQWTGESTLLDIRTPGWFYQCQEDTRMRDYSLSANPDKYSQLYISDWMTLEDYMSMQMEDVTFEYKAGGWVEQDSMSMLGSEDLTSLGITYVLADGQSLEIGDTITINIIKSYVWRNIQVQPDDFIVDFLPTPNMENWTKVVFLAGSDMLSPIEGYPYGKWYRCVERYNETTEEWYYEWEMLPGQDGLQQLSELPTDNTGIVSDGQCICYVGEDNAEYENDFETIYLRKGHIYRAVVTDADDENLLHINYYETYTSQFGVMPYPNAEYEGVITQYTGEDGDYTNGHFYKCVPTGEMTGPLSKQKHDGDWEVSINPSVLETQVSDPTEPMKFTFQSQAEGAQWLIVRGDVYTTIDLADYGITITGEVPYGSRLYVKYIEPQEEYEWWDIRVGDYIEQFQYMPEGELEYMGRTVQYVGNEEGYTPNYFYQCMPVFEPTTEGSVTMTMTNEEKFAEVIKIISTGAVAFSVSFHQDGGVGSYWWVIDALDADGNFIGGSTFDANAATFEAETGIKIEGTVDNNTEITTDLSVVWQQVDVQPSSGGASTDVQINGISITSNDVANIVTESAYNATTNKIATMADVSVPTYDSTYKTIIFS